MLAWCHNDLVLFINIVNTPESAPEKGCFFFSPANTHGFAELRVGRGKENLSRKIKNVLLLLGGFRCVVLGLKILKGVK